MRFTKSKVDGAFIIELEKFEDERGFVAYAWSEKEFLEQGISTKFLEMIMSYNTRKGTLRGMHFQNKPFAQAKLVRCTNGAIYDVAIDLRPGSRTYKKWDAIELTARNRRMFYIPEGCAHGFQTLEDETEVLYQISTVYSPDNASGVRWNDPAFGIEWPEDERTIIGRDRDYPDFRE
jgi:dTDP-4-dehydrorhamnose 3,5-epimerase